MTFNVGTVYMLIYLLQRETNGPNSPFYFIFTFNFDREPNERYEQLRSYDRNKTGKRTKAATVD